MSRGDVGHRWIESTAALAVGLAVGYAVVITLWVLALTHG